MLDLSLALLTPPSSDSIVVIIISRSSLGVIYRSMAVFVLVEVIKTGHDPDPLTVPVIVFPIIKVENHTFSRVLNTK